MTLALTLRRHNFTPATLPRLERQQATWDWWTSDGHSGLLEIHIPSPRLLGGSVADSAFNALQDAIDARFVGATELGWLQGGPVVGSVVKIRPVSGGNHDR
jgi:hypothetical protein